MKSAQMAQARPSDSRNESTESLHEWQIKVARLPEGRTTWTQQHVQIYLNWCKVVFDLDGLIPESQFNDIDGNTLCCMTWEEFMERCPFAGDIVFEHLNG